MKSALQTSDTGPLQGTTCAVFQRDLELRVEGWAEISVREIVKFY